MTSDAVPDAGGRRRARRAPAGDAATGASGVSGAAQHDFAELAGMIRERGLLDSRRGYYSARIAINGAILAAAATMFFLLGDSWWQVVTAVVLAVVFTQLAFVGHDAGHRQIFRSSRANDVVGQVHGCLTGISYGWWIGKHRKHHANPNHEDSDPDIDIQVLAFTADQSRAKRGALRWIAKHQAVLFFPMLTLEGFVLHLHSIRAVLQRQVKDHRLETVLLCAHVLVYLTTVLLVLSPLKAAVFIVVHQALFGVYMGCAFAPNHKGMPTIPPEQKLDFLRKQVLTSRNIRGGRFVDVLLGGLNYQIEHHLFPSMPRPNLRHAQEIVSRFCTSREVSYSQCGLFRSYAIVLQHLHEVGTPLRTPVPQQS